MLDMFPEESLSDRASNPDEPLKQRHRFYDITNVKRVSIKEHPRTTNTNNTYQSNDIEFYSGGIRPTVFDCVPPWLTRWTPTFSDGKLKHFTYDVHRVEDARVADLTCVLFHYKFLDEYFHKQAASAVREENYVGNSRQYKKYLQVLESTPSLQVKRESAGELRSINDLVENGFLVVSEEYMLFVYEQARKNGTGHALRQGLREGEPDGLEDPAFDRTRAQAKVQSLRAKRLEQRLEQLPEQLRQQHQRDLENRLEDLRENNRRSKKQALEKLREQNKRKIEELQEQNKRKLEKLSRRLDRAKKEKTGKDDRNSARQSPNMRVSRGRRLLNKLSRFQDRVLGRKQQR